MGRLGEFGKDRWRRKGAPSKLARRRAEKPVGVPRGGQIGGKPAGFRWATPRGDDHNQKSGEVPLFINRDYLLAVPNIAEMALLATI